MPISIKCSVTPDGKFVNVTGLEATYYIWIQSSNVQNVHKNMFNVIRIPRGHAVA
jgi:hypothetical protein